MPRDDAPLKIPNGILVPVVGRVAPPNRLVAVTPYSWDNLKGAAAAVLKTWQSDFRLTFVVGTDMTVIYIYHAVISKVAKTSMFALNEFAWNALSLTAIPLTVYPFIVALLTDGPVHADFLWMGVGLGVAEVCSLGIKHLTKHIGPEFLRPPGAKDCNALCNDGHVEGRPAFPSGHMITVLFFFTYLLLLSIYYNKVRVIRTAVVLAGLLFTLGMASARYHKKCHSLFQIISGSVIGIVLSIIWFLTGYA